jgi:hypothetical protein
MSQENVEVFRRAGEAFNRRDIDAITDLLTEDFEFRRLTGALLPISRVMLTTAS